MLGWAGLDWGDPRSSSSSSSSRSGEGVCLSVCAYQMKSVQWLQKVGCLKKRAMNLWSLTSWTFFCRRAPLRAKRWAVSGSELGSGAE